ncbi:MAG: hypothetical protein IKS66_02660 [Oscillospiraceae bacterium]|nr:hypothetical protein [Oscillospiraceae bacterium]
MKHCKRFLSFLAALALLLSMSLPSFSMAQDAPEAWAEDAELWGDEALWGDEDEAPAPEYGELQEDADPAPAADAAAEAPAADAPADETAEADTPDDGPEAAADAAADETAEADAPDDEPEAADEADADAPADAEEPSVSELLARPEEDPDDGGFELAPAPAFPEALDADEPERPEGAASVGDAAEIGDAAQATPDPADGGEDWEDADFDGEAAPLEFPDLEDEADEAPAPEERAVLRFRAETHRGGADNVIVTAEAEPDALPSDAVLCVEAVGDARLLDAVVAEKQSLERRVSLVRALRSGFCDAQGRPLQPDKPVRVTLSFVEAGETWELYRVDAPESAELAELDFAQIETLAGEPEEAAGMAAELLGDAPEDGDALERRSMFAQLRFELDGSGVYAIVGMETVVFEYLSADGEAWTVTVSYDPERFGFLRDAVLKAELLEGAALEACLEATARTLGTTPEALDAARFFDIRLCAPDGTEYHELGGDVRVTVRLSTPLCPDPDAVLRAVHFADGLDAPPQIAAAELSADGMELRFAQSSFSVTGTVMQLDDSKWLRLLGSYVVLVKERGSNTYYMLEVVYPANAPSSEDNYPYTFYQYKVKLTEARVEEKDGKLTLHIDDDPEQGTDYSDLDSIKKWLWYSESYTYNEIRPANGAGGNPHGLQNVATGCYLGPARVGSSTPYNFCAARVGRDGTDVNLPSVGCTACALQFYPDEGNPRTLVSKNQFVGRRDWWYFKIKKNVNGDYLQGVRVGTLTASALDGALEFYFVSDILINGQPAGVGGVQPENNPSYSFYTYADNPPQGGEPQPELSADPPTAKKTLLSRGDGTYDLSLSVTADTRDDSFRDGSAEVVLVVDVTKSLDQKGAAEAERDALLEIGEMLMQKGVPIHVVLFAKGAWTDFVTYTEENSAGYRDLINKAYNWTTGDCPIGDSTNWEAGLKLGAEVLRQIDDQEEQGAATPYRDKYLIFVSDGEPNTRLTNENEYLSVTPSLSEFAGGRGYSEDEATYEAKENDPGLKHSLELASLLVSANANFISLYVRGDYTEGNIEVNDAEGLERMKLLAAQAQAGGVYANGKYYSLAAETLPLGTYYQTDPEDGESVAGELIAAARFVLRKFFYQDVSLRDGLTAGTALAGELTEGAVPAFSYRIERPVKNESEPRKYTGEEVTDGGGKIWLRFFRDTDGGKKYLSASDETKNLEEALLFHPASYDSDERKLSWDIQTAAPSDAYRLLDGATYTVSFPVWPNQETFDTVAGAMNGVAGELPGLEREDGTWKLSTNTVADVGYTPLLMSKDGEEPPEWRIGDPKQTPIANPDPVDVEPWPVKARKVWLDGGTEHSDIKSLTLKLWQDENDYIGPIVLTEAGGWLSADFSISPGMMVKRTEETEDWGKAVTFNGKPYVLLNEGYGYYFTEDGMEFTEGTDASSYQYQLEKDVFYPILVDGVPVNAHRVADGDSYAYTDDGQLVRPLLAKNWMKGIYITKQVVDDKGNPVQPDAQTEQPGFKLNVTLTAPNGDVSDFPLLDGSEPDSSHIVRYYVLDRDGNNITPDSENYLVFKDGAVRGTFIIGAGDMILFPDVPEGTCYSVEELEIPAGYALDGMVGSAQDTETGSFVPVEELADGGYQAVASANRLVVRNKMGEFEPARIVIDKFETGERSQKLSGASFVLYRYPTQKELDEDESLSAETPLYYSRGPDDEKPQFRPEPELALTVTTDADGHAEFTDLPDGLYYLLETEAPVDYQKLVAPIAVTVDTSWLKTADNPTPAQIAAALVFVVPIANLPKSTLPATGGYGAARWTGLGLLLLWGGAAGGLVLRGRRRRAPQ